MVNYRTLCATVDRLYEAGNRGDDLFGAIRLNRNVIATSKDGLVEILGPLQNQKRLDRPEGMSGRQWVKAPKQARRDQRSAAAENMTIGSDHADEVTAA